MGGQQEQVVGEGFGQELFDWVECMAEEGVEEGVELPEPTRDADGNLVIVGNGIAIGYGMQTDFGPIAEEDMKAADAVRGNPPLGGHRRRQRRNPGVTLVDARRDGAVAVPSLPGSESPPLQGQSPHVSPGVRLSFRPAKAA